MSSNEDTPLSASQRIIQEYYRPRGERSTSRTQDAAQHTDQAGEQAATDQDTTDDARASAQVIQRYSRTQKKA